MEGAPQRQNRAVLMHSYPQGMPDADADFRVAEWPLPELKEGEILAKTLYLSVDPYMRARMRGNTRGYFPPFPLGKPVNGGGVAQVVESKNSNWSRGDVFQGYFEWCDYNVFHADQLSDLRRLNDFEFPLSTAIGALGMPGMTAYFGLLDLTHPKEGETLVVSGAAGAVGSLVGQIGKIKGCRVVGIAGSDEKIQYLKNELGFDEAINYKTTRNMEEAIGRACPQGVDVYFDNVGGETTDAVMAHINNFGRVSVCGAISGYNKDEVDLGPRDSWKLISKNVRKEGFIVTVRWMDRFPEGIRQMGQWIKEGKLKFEETVREGLENTPRAFVEMLSGHNVGKMVVKCADPARV